MLIHVDICVYSSVAMLEESKYSQMYFLMFIVHIKYLVNMFAFWQSFIFIVWIYLQILQNTNNKIWGKGKNRESKMTECNIALLLPRLLATGFCMHMGLVFYLMPTSHNTYGSKVIYWYWPSGRYITYFNSSNDLFAECTAINIITSDIPAYCSHINSFSV